jgi:hypothetical protein
MFGAFKMEILKMAETSELTSSDSANATLLHKLVQSLSKSQPIQTEETSLIDKFVLSHQATYQLPGQMYKQMMIKIVENRLLSPSWWPSTPEGKLSAPQ